MTSVRFVVSGRSRSRSRSRAPSCGALFVVERLPAAFEPVDLRARWFELRLARDLPEHLPRLPSRSPTASYTMPRLSWDDVVRLAAARRVAR
jgi:hypothetical protein